MSPTEQSRNVFYGFWTILIHLQFKTNFITSLSEIQQLKFTRLLGYYVNDFSLLNLSFQTVTRLNLESIRLFGANLSNGNLLRVNLSYATIFETNLVNSDLSRASLSNAYIDGSDLEGINLSRADLDSLNMPKKPKYGSHSIKGFNLGVVATIVTNYVNLNRADLSFTNLSNANLRYFNLREANLFNAELNKSILGSTDLSKSVLPGIKYITDLVLNDKVNINQAYIQDKNWLDKFRQSIQFSERKFFDTQKYYISPPLTPEEIENSPNPYLKEIFEETGQPIYQIRLKPGETEEE